MSVSGYHGSVASFLGNSPTLFLLLEIDSYSNSFLVVSGSIVIYIRTPNALRFLFL